VLIYFYARNNEKNQLMKKIVAFKKIMQFAIYDCIFLILKYLYMQNK